MNYEDFLKYVIEEDSVRVLNLPLSRLVSKTTKLKSTKNKTLVDNEYKETEGKIKKGL